MMAAWDSDEVPEREEQEANECFMTNSESKDEYFQGIKKSQGTSTMVAQDI
jgi:hypothetical protein